MKKGRPASIPDTAFGQVFLLYGQGRGYRAIAGLLEHQGIYTTKSSVERLIRGLPAYTGRRVMVATDTAELLVRASGRDHNGNSMG